MTVLLDVNLSPDWIEFLACHGFEAIHWSSIGAGDAPDTQILAHVVKANCILLTQDLDFGTILSATKATRPTVVQIRAGRVKPLTLGLQVVAALKQIPNQPAQEAMITVEWKRTRLRVLPIDSIS